MARGAGSAGSPHAAELCCQVDEPFGQRVQVSFFTVHNKTSSLY